MWSSGSRDRRLPKIGRPGGPGGRFWDFDLKKKIYKYQMIVEIVKSVMRSVVVSPLYQSFIFVFSNKEIVSGIMMVLFAYFVLCLGSYIGNSVEDAKEWPTMEWK